MTNIQAIIFDMDGLMIDSEQNQSRSMGKVLEEQGIKPIFNDVGIMHGLTIGIPAHDNFKNLKKQHGLQASIEELHSRKKEIYHELLKDGVTAMPGLFELFEYLRDKPLKKAIASSSIKRDIEMVVGHLDLRDHFDALVSVDQVKRGKPAPDLFLEAAKQLGVQPEHCMVLEDASQGVTAGKAAGMKVIAVPNRFTEHENFDHADRVISSLKELDMALINSL
jgi:beta-phosphoglucomutase family hydrolase